MKKGFSILQRVGRAFMLPIAVLPMAGILLGVGGAFTSKAVIETYHLTFLEPGTLLNKILVLFSNSGSFVFANLSVIFAVGVAIGLANQNKETAALSGLLGFLLFHTVIGTVLGFMGYTPETTTVQAFMDRGFTYDVAVGKAEQHHQVLRAHGGQAFQQLGARRRNLPHIHPDPPQTVFQQLGRRAGGVLAVEKDPPGPADCRGRG